MAIIQHGITTYNLEEIGIITLDINISSPVPKHHTGDVEGSDGVIDYGTDYEPRIIKCKFAMIAVDELDYPLLRNEVFYIFRTKQSFYFIEKRRPMVRWKVKVNSSFDIEQVYTSGKFEVELIAYLPFAESIETTQHIDKNGINANDGLWGFGMGLIAENDSLRYTHIADVNTPFKIYNAGNVPIHPFQQKLKITIKNVQGSLEKFQIINLTNMSRALINIPLQPSDVVIYNGPNVTKNGLAFLRDTDKNFISLD